MTPQTRAFLEERSLSAGVMWIIQSREAPCLVKFFTACAADTIIPPDWM